MIKFLWYRNIARGEPQRRKLVSRWRGYYGNTVPSLFNEYLQNSLKSFTEGQQQLCHQFNADSMKVFQKMAKDNMDMWRSVQDNFLKMSGFNLGQPDKKEDE